MVENLKSPRTKVEDLKTVVTDMKDWISCFNDTIFKCLYERKCGKDIEGGIYQKSFSETQKIRGEMIDRKLITLVDDEIICENPIIVATMSDLDLMLHMQLLPLWDYLFVTYEAEMLSVAASSISGLKWNESIMDKDFYKLLFNWSSQILGLNPVHLSHIKGLLKFQYKHSLAPSLLYFLKHTRHGFSTDGLSALSFKIDNNDIQKENVLNMQWNNNYSWTKQQPLLTHIFSSILEKTSDSSLMCHFPLGSYSQKIEQLKKAQALVWKHFDVLANREKTFRHYSASIVISWFHNLIKSVVILCGLEESELNKDDIPKLFEKLQIADFVKAENIANVFLLTFDSIFELKTALVEGTDDANLQWLTGKAYVLVGLLTSMLLRPRYKFDPAKKTDNKVSYFKSSISDIAFENELRKWMDDITCGQSLYKEWLPEHPHIEGLQRLGEQYANNLAVAEMKVSFRSNEMSFVHFKEDIFQFMDSLGSPVRILDIISKLRCTNDDMENEDQLNCYAPIILKAQNDSENLQSFVDNMLKKYQLFPDMLIPFLLGVEQIAFGLSMCCHSVTIKESLIGDPKQKVVHINEFLRKFSQFSTEGWESSLHMIRDMLQSINNFTFIFSGYKEHFPNRGQMLYKFMKSAVLELINEIKFRSYHPKHKLSEIKDLLFSAFHCFYKVFHIQDVIRKRKQAEEEKLFKTVKYDNELSDEEKMEKDLKEMFPVYEEDFREPNTEMDSSDFKSEQNHMNCNDIKTGENTDDDLCPMNFSDVEMFEVCQLHANAVALLTDTNSSKNLFITLHEEVDIVTPALLRHEVVSSIVTTLGHRLDSSLEKNLIAEQLLLCQELQKVKGQDTNEYYDIYHDPNPVQVLTIKPILQQLTSHACGLLKEFPENPSLMQILVKTRRVLSFPVSDPLMKFVVGLELVLEAVQLWEQNAHSKVSLKTDIKNITGKIIEFRSMELNVWKKGLQNVIRKHYVRSSKWWFFMFGLFYDDNTYTESEQACLKKGLQQCLDDSPIGEFSARLNILHSFLQEGFVQSFKKLKRCYVNILFNVYKYYEQFLPAIESEIAQIRKPIEKELKDFVKIARWNDLNFYAVKASIQESHRYVLKRVKKFEDALQKPAKTVFSFPSKKSLNSEMGCWTLDINKKDFIYNLTEIRTKCFKERREEFFKIKFPKCQKNMRKVTEEIADTFPVVGYVNTLNDFCGNIIEALESATIDGQKTVCTRLRDKEQAKSKEKKQALLKIQNKKQMLATLFKNLKVIGLSYRQGMMSCDEDRISEFMSISAFDISKMKILKSDLSFKELLSKSSSETNHYLYKSLAQYAQLRRLIESPSKDLTVDIIHRIKGYASNLLTLISSQRMNIVNMLKDVDDFGCFLSVLSSVYDKQDFAYEKNLTIVPPQQYFKESNLQISNLMMMVMVATSQFSALLDCAPESVFLTEELHPSNLDKKHLSGVLKTDPAWSSIKLALDTLNCDIKNLLQQLSDLKFDENIASWDHLRTFSSIYHSVQKSMECLMSQIFEHCDQDSALIQNLCKLYNTVCHRCNFARVEEDAILDSQMHGEPLENNEENSKFAKLCRSLARQTAIAVQKMVVFSASTETGEPEGNIVPENLFTKKITYSLSKAKECLGFEEISKVVKKLKKYFIHSQNSTESLLPNDKNCRLLVNLAPFVNQYYQIVKVHLATSMGMHRTSCKFLTILLEIFMILATKGFCIPSELEAAAAKAGPTKFEDIESGGLGEGEGTKDVSDQIESEDQLDDAMQEGQEKEENDDSKNKDLKDEKQGIEMSDDFDGKMHSAEEDAEESGDEEENKNVEDLDKQMGEVESTGAEKLDDKIWGSDSENEDELNEDDGSGGVNENMASELVAKDNKIKEDSDDENGKQEKQSQEVPVDQPNEEYEGEKPDPMINAPTQEPEVVDLPDDMEITDEVDKDAEGEHSEEIGEPNLDDSTDEPEEEIMGEGDKEGGSDEVEENVDGESKEGENIADQEETDHPLGEFEAEQNEYILPTQTPTEEVQALPSSEMKKSSSDPVQTEEMDWETGAQSGEDQHKEGLSDATNLPSTDPGHEGKKSSFQSQEASKPRQAPKLKPPGENRSVDESAEEQNAKNRPARDKKSNDNPSERNEDGGETAEMYEHVSKEEESKVQAIDIATQEQAKIRTAQSQMNNVDDDDDDCIQLSSDDEEPCNKAVGETLKTSQNEKPGDNSNKEGETADILEGEIVQTHNVSRGAESTIHTQHELWRSMLSNTSHSGISRHTQNIHMTASHQRTSISEELWTKLEIPVSNLSQELCEQLRLVLEPTKMSKFKGGYRTGKRINMKKIIPYIASEFRKDKIWLRRTKPSKREYQIMLAMDDSSSMGYNNAKQLAFESLVVLGRSLTLLEAGELSVVSFGEHVQLLHSFQEQFSPSSGAKILEQITFDQKETNIAQLLDYATHAMVQARNSSRFSGSKETAQLLIIISDGRNIFREGESKVRNAVKTARDNNIFMVFLVLDNMENKNSILDGKYSLVCDDKIKSFPYMDKFPFPFYIILREISALPQVLGEALRQWFELVTSVDR